MQNWWHDVACGARLRVTLLQVDLGGHSQWLAQEYADDYLGPYLERSKFARTLREQLRPLTYDCLFWAGDGGVFAARHDRDGHPFLVCEAADMVFRSFNEWRGEKSVDLRVTATTMELSIDPDAGNWCGPDFNEFLKYERQLALPNAFVITGDLRAALVGSPRARFVTPRQVRLPSGRQIATFVDKMHPVFVPESALAFGPWLAKAVKSHRIFNSELLSGELIRVGQCTILDTARRETGYSEVFLDVQATSPISGAIRVTDIDNWRQRRELLVARKVAGTSTQVTRFVGELSDDPQVRIEYRPIDYVDARAYLSTLEDDDKAARHYRSEALNVLGSGTSLPNILATGIVVLVGTEDNPHLVIANRKIRGGGFHGSTWSVSIGEQFMPVSGLRGKKKLARDLSIEASIRRGLREELLGDQFDGPIEVAVHAFCMEDYFNNYIFVATADLRPLTFEALASSWLMAEDRAEHDAIAAIPANEDVLDACICTEGLPADLWLSLKASCHVKFGPGLTSLPDEGNAHGWQPNSHVRLALAKWYTQRLNTISKGTIPNKTA